MALVKAGCPCCAGLKCCADTSAAKVAPRLADLWHPSKNRTTVSVKGGVRRSRVFQASHVLATSPAVCWLLCEHSLHAWQVRVCDAVEQARRHELECVQCVGLQAAQLIVAMALEVVQFREDQIAKRERRRKRKEKKEKKAKKKGQDSPEKHTKKDTGEGNATMPGASGGTGGADGRRWPNSTWWLAHFRSGALREVRARAGPRGLIKGSTRRLLRGAREASAVGAADGPATSSVCVVS